MYASPPAHTLTFRSKLNQISVPRTIIDHALSLTTPDEGSSKFQRTQTPYRHTPLINSNMKHLVLALFNTRSIYGRETWITELIKKHHFAVMGIQDPKLRMNNMPMGLFRTVLYKEDPTPGLRGLITVIHPAWAHLIAIPAIDNEDCSYIQWVEVQCLPDPVYVANVYLPNHRDASWKSRANDLVQTLITNISDLGDNARVVVMGDLNADLGSGKGDNAVL